MSKVAYVWVLTLVVFGFLYHSHESAQQKDAIQDATRQALYYGLRAGCERDNQQHAAAENCDLLAQELVRRYFKP